jgi:predicted ATPase
MYEGFGGVVMIKKVTVKYFKRFKDQPFELSEHVILAGPNNSGKSTLLQAIVVWNLAMRQWLLRRKDSKARERTGVPITRKDFTALPLREMGLLWTNKLTGLQQDERSEGQKQGTPRLLSIALEGEEASKKWRSEFEFKYTSTEQITVKPVGGGEESVPKEAEELKIVHIPPFSGIGAEETRYVQREYQDLLIGQGKPGDILRNLLLEIHERCKQDATDASWTSLCQHIEDVFRYRLLPPLAEGRPFIVCEYIKGIPRDKQHGKDGLPSLDIATAGSGFLQVLLIMAFFYARPASVLLMDEPDAHLHVILQKQVYDRLRTIASEKKCQLIIATHSEVLIDSTSPTQILSFINNPHPLLSETDRDEVREAVKRLTATDLLLAETSPGVLYLEGNSDFNILRAWAGILDHQTKDWFSGTSCFWHNNQGRHPREARDHFFALRAIRKDRKGLLLLDGDNRNLPVHELRTDGLAIESWKRYEIESYLMHPIVLRRFMERRTVSLYADKGMAYLDDELPKSALRDPLKDSEYMERTPVSKSILPGMFKAAGLDVPKEEYYLIAEVMSKEEIPSEIIAKLDAIAEVVL